MKKTIFTGSAVAIVTPMNEDGSINYDNFADRIEEQIAGGTDAIVVCGTTGESAAMTDEEHKECIRFCVEKVAKRVPVIAGAGSNDTAYAIQLSKEAEALGADALLLVTPYYNKTSQRGLVAHFSAIADSVSLPIILYNVPSRTGVNISVETYKELAKKNNIVAAKEASGNISAVAKIAAETDLDIYSGNDDQIVPIMSLGGKGVISVLANCLPAETHEIASYCLEGDYKKAAELQLRLLEFTNDLFIDVNPIPVKEALNFMGKKVDGCREQLKKMEEEMMADFIKALEPLLETDKEDLTPVKITTGIFRCLKENADICTVTLGDYGDKDFALRLINLGREKCVETYSRYFGSATPKQIEFFYAFVSAGCIGLLQKWLAEGMVSSPEEIAAMAENIMMYGMGALERA